MPSTRCVKGPGKSPDIACCGTPDGIVGCCCDSDRAIFSSSYKHTPDRKHSDDIMDSENWGGGAVKVNGLLTFGFGVHLLYILV